MTIEQRLVKNLKKIFGKHLDAVLGYGSFFHGNSNKYSDIDLVIVLKRYHRNDIQKIKQLVNASGIKKTFSPVILYKDRVVSDGLFFSVNTCGSFILAELNHAKVLYGKNIFQQLRNPGKLAVDISLLQKIQQYNYQLKLNYLGLTEICFSEEGFYLEKKRIKMMLDDLEMLVGISPGKILKTSVLKKISVLSKKNYLKQSLILMEISDEIYFKAINYVSSTYQTKSI